MSTQHGHLPPLLCWQTDGLSRVSPPVTSRQAREEERDGQNYCFVTREQMEKDIKEGRYLEHGEYDGNLYGTKIDSIHEVVDAGRTCILDVNPQVCWKCPGCVVP